MELLDRTNEEIAKYVRRTKGVYTKARYREIAKKLREISKALREKVGSGIDIDGVIGYELRKQEKLLDLLKGDIVKVKGGEVNFLFPSTEQIKTAALFKPVTEGFTYDSYLNGIQEGLYNVWDSAVRTGYLTGQTTQQIVRNVMGGISPETKLRNPGMIDRLRNSVQANTRTVLQSFAHETRSRVYAENEKYFGDGETEYKYEWLSTLDNRTCIACGELDGRLFRTLEEVPQIPLHVGCRCVLLPYFDIKGGTRASPEGYLDDDTDFESWLRDQDEKTQLDVLGRTRYEMFRDGTPMKQFVDGGRVLTLKELGERI